MERTSNTRREAKKESLRQQTRSPSVRSRSKKESGQTKRTPYFTAQAVALAWAKASTQARPQAVARELAALLEEAHRTPIGPAIATLTAGWKAKYKPSTLHAHTLQLHKLLRAIDHQCGTSLAGQVQPSPKAKPRQRILTEEQLQTLQRGAPPFLRMFLALAGTMALRSGEAMRAGWVHFNQEHNTLAIETKGGHVRTFPVTPEVRELIAQCPPQAETFISGLRGHHTSRRVIYKHWRRLLKSLGLPEDFIPHDLRRTAAVAIYRETKNVLAAKALLGHDSLDSTARYLQPYDKEAMDALRAQLHRWIPTKGEPKQ